MFTVGQRVRNTHPRGPTGTVLEVYSKHVIIVRFDNCVERNGSQYDSNGNGWPHAQFAHHLMPINEGKEYPMNTHSIDYQASEE